MARECSRTHVGQRDPVLVKVAIYGAGGVGGYLGGRLAQAGAEVCGSHAVGATERAVGLSARRFSRSRRSESTGRERTPR